MQFSPYVPVLEISSSLLKNAYTFFFTQLFNISNRNDPWYPFKKPIGKQVYWVRIVFQAKCYGLFKNIV